MDYETDIAIHQYSSDGDFYYNLKVTDVMNMDYQYMDNATTLEGVMDLIKLHLKQYQNAN
jgi:hypothetical protein